MASDLTLSTPLGQATDPGAPPSPETQAQPETQDLAGWYKSSMDAILPRFEAATKAAQDSIAKRQSELAELRGRTLAAPGLPESPETPPAPAAPKITSRPFLAGGPGDDAITSLNKAMAGLGLIAQMGVGIKGGNPSGALAAYTGALEGWKAGDLRRASNEWTTYLGELKTYDRDVANIRQKYDDAIRKWGADQNKLKTELGILAAEHGLGREAIEMSFREPMMAFEQLNTTTKILGDLQANAAKLAFENMQWVENRAFKLADLKLKTDELGLKREEAERKGKFDALMERVLTGAGQPGAGGIPTMPPGVALHMGPVTLSAPPPASSEAINQALGIERLRGAMTNIDAIKGTPELRAQIDAYLGPIGGRVSWYQKNVPGGIFGQVPQSVVDMEQNIASYRNYVIKLITGAQMGEKEADRIRQEIPETTDPPDIFWRKYETSKKQVGQMEDIIRRGQAGRGNLIPPASPAGGGWSIKEIK